MTNQKSVVLRRGIVTLILACAALAAPPAYAQSGDGTGRGSGAVFHIVTDRDFNERDDGLYYWKNGTTTKLRAGFDAAGTAVSGRDVYIMGRFYASDGLKACYWKNGGGLMPLGIKAGSTGLSRNIITAIAVSGEDDYIAGSYHDERTRKACYWKNGVRVNLPVPHNVDSFADAISVVGSDVYVAGGNSGGIRYYTSLLDELELLSDSGPPYAYTACYWKNGVRTDLPSGAPDARVTAMTVVDGNVYVAGAWYEKSVAKACYWKNGVRTDIGDGTAARIVVVGSDVHIVGREKGKVWYWKNGVRIDLGVDTLGFMRFNSNDFYFPFAIAVLGRDVYIAACYRKRSDNKLAGSYWKNGVRTDFVNLPGCDVVAIAITAE